MLHKNLLDSNEGENLVILDNNATLKRVYWKARTFVYNHHETCCWIISMPASHLLHQMPFSNGDVKGTCKTYKSPTTGKAKSFCGVLNQQKRANTEKLYNNITFCFDLSTNQFVCFVLRSHDVSLSDILCLDQRYS